MFSLPMEEAESGVVEISDFGSDEISAMLEYMYTGLVKDDVMYKLAPELLALSDKYAVIPLKELCEDFMASKLTTTNFLQIVILADRYSATKLKKACINRLAIDGRAVLQSQEWEDLKSDNKNLANELLHTNDHKEKKYTISAMLEYMYTGLVKDDVMYKRAPELLALSDKYAVIPLKDLCEAFLASQLTTTNFLQIVILADRYSASKLKKACINRLAIDGRAVLQSKEWEDLKSKDKGLANELLELMIKFC